MAESKRYGYGGYVIEPRSYEVLDRKTRKSAGWVPSCWLYLDQGGTVEIQQISFPSNKTTNQEDADRVALTGAYQWIEKKI